LPPAEWLGHHRWLLVAALIPVSIYGVLQVDMAVQKRFCKKLHFALALQVAERLRRRQVFIATTEVQVRPPLGGPTHADRWTSGLPRVCALAAERQLSPQALRELEVQRRERLAAEAVPSSTSTSTLSSSLTSLPLPPMGHAPVADSRAPAVGRQRARWLRARLVRLLQEDTAVCLSSTPWSKAEELLALFERDTGELFSDTPGAPLTSRVRGFAKVLGNITREVNMVPPLLSAERIEHRGAYRVWNRLPRVPVDMEVWRRGHQPVSSAAPVVRLRDEMADVDAGLAAWFRGHRHLVPTDVERGESGMALLLLWEVDHGRPFPAGVEGANAAAKLASFCRRLQARVAQDDQLSAWLEVKEMQFPLAPGLPPSHQLRWSVRVDRPGAGAPQEWYVDFVRRWQTYLASLTSPSTRKRALGEEGARRPSTRQRTAAASTSAAAVDDGASLGDDQSPPAAQPPVRGRAAAVARRGWLQPRRDDALLSSTGVGAEGSGAVSSGPWAGDDRVDDLVVDVRGAEHIGGRPPAP
jgi:hypothetical protein